MRWKFLPAGLIIWRKKLNESYSSLEQKVQERTREYLDATKELQRALQKTSKNTGTTGSLGKK